MKDTIFQNETVTLLYNTDKALYSLDFNSKGIIDNVGSAIKNEEGSLIRSKDFLRHHILEEEFQDVLGIGTKIVIEHSGGQDFSMTEIFCVYQEGFLTIQLLIKGEKEIKTNYMAPIYGNVSTSKLIVGSEDIQFLSVPFDNDKWAKFISYPIAYSKTSYEFTAIYDKKNNHGFVLGSLNHDNWKTGIIARTGENTDTTLQVFAGIASEDTRDLYGMQHGFLYGNQIESPRIFLGYYDSYQDGFLVFGKCNAMIHPPLKWEGPVPFGWNSWASLMGSLTFEKYQEASDFMKTIQHTYCDTNETQYINFDACWQNFITKMNDSVEHVKDNGQLPGTYMAPFITMLPSFSKEVSGTDGNYLYRDLLLKDKDGEILPQVDGLYSLDPTHPGTQAHIFYETQRFIKWEFQYVKVDFLGHAAREGDFYNKSITTGVQAYNYGMVYLNECLSYERAGYSIFLSLSIDPIFPHGYGHARRISCDAFGSLDQSAYLNNCITYLWWMNDCLYRFNDPDHIVVYKTYDKHSTTLEEGRTRYNTAVICGTLMINSDDYSFLEARERAEHLLTNEEINEVARKGVSFRTVSGNYGEFAADVFMRKDENCTLIAVFNYSISEAKEVNIFLREYGLDTGKTYIAKNLWSKKSFSCTNTLSLKLKPAESTIIRIED